MSMTRSSDIQIDVCVCVCVQARLCATQRKISIQSAFTKIVVFNCHLFAWQSEKKTISNQEKMYADSICASAKSFFSRMENLKAPFARVNFRQRDNFLPSKLSIDVSYTSPWGFFFGYLIMSSLSHQKTRARTFTIHSSGLGSHVDISFDIRLVSFTSHRFSQFDSYTIRCSVYHSISRPFSCVISTFCRVFFPRDEEKSEVNFFFSTESLTSY